MARHALCAKRIGSSMRWLATLVLFGALAANADILDDAKAAGPLPP